jgi:hypothetical protein
VQDEEAAEKSYQTYMIDIIYQMFGEVHPPWWRDLEGPFTATCHPFL